MCNIQCCAIQKVIRHENTCCWVLKLLQTPEAFRVRGSGDLMRDLGPGVLDLNSFGDFEQVLTAHELTLRDHQQAIAVIHGHLNAFHQQLKNLVTALRDLNQVLQHCDAASFRAHNELAQRVEVLEGQPPPNRQGIWATARRFFSTCTSVLCWYLRGSPSAVDDHTAEPASGPASGSLTVRLAELQNPDWSSAVLRVQKFYKKRKTILKDFLSFKKSLTL